jgi:hypothetical protein
MIFVFGLIGFVSSFAIGYFCGISSKQKHKQVGGNNCIQIQTDEILLDADVNREISEITSSANDSPKNKILRDITKMINDAAQDGQKNLYLEDKYDFNKRIRKYLTISDVKNFFESDKYKVKFMFPTLGYSDIAYISWE